MTESCLACTVRDCGLPLERRTGTWVCARGHSYDVARSGYINLLQPQDRRSLAAGDTKAAIEARARLFAAGVGRTIIEAFVKRAAALDLSDRPSAISNLRNLPTRPTGPTRPTRPTRPVVVDLGCGSGDVLASLARLRRINGIGIDLSTAAADHAARRYRDLTWVVANADRRLPLVDGSIALALSFHARRNPAECARVLAPNGFLLIAIPAQDDLIELRTLVLGHRVERDRGTGLLVEHEALFRLIERSTVRERRQLDRTALLDLLRTTYRGERLSASERVQALTTAEVTMASEIFLFAPN